MVREISIHQTRNETEALLLEGKLIKEYKPRYNTDFTDDKQFLMVRVDVQNAIPRFRLCRNRKEDGSHYYGTFCPGRDAAIHPVGNAEEVWYSASHDAKPEKIGEGNGDFMMMPGRRFLPGTMKPRRKNMPRGSRKPVNFWKGGPRVGWLNCVRRCKNGRKRWILNGRLNCAIWRTPCPRRSRKTADSPVRGPRMSPGNGGHWKGWANLLILPVRHIPSNVSIFLMCPEPLWWHQWYALWGQAGQAGVPKV